MPTFAFTRCAVLALAIAALGLSGCGRRGNLEPSPDSGISAKEAREQAADQGKATVPQQSTDGTGSPRVRGVTAPRKPFILDPLL